MMFFIAHVFNNYAFDFNIPMPLHMIVRAVSKKNLNIIKVDIYRFSTQEMVETCSILLFEYGNSFEMVLELDEYSRSSILKLRLMLD